MALEKLVITGGTPLKGEVTINGAKNAGILATTILSTSNDELYKKICDYKAQMNEAVLAKNEKLQRKASFFNKSLSAQAIFNITQLLISLSLNECLL